MVVIILQSWWNGPVLSHFSVLQLGMPGVQVMNMYLQFSSQGQKSQGKWRKFVLCERGTLKEWAPISTHSQPAPGLPGVCMSFELVSLPISACPMTSQGISHDTTSVFCLLPVLTVLTWTDQLQPFWTDWQRQLKESCVFPLIPISLSPTFKKILSSLIEFIIYGFWKVLIFFKKNPVSDETHMHISLDDSLKSQGKKSINENQLKESAQHPHTDRSKMSF